MSFAQLEAAEINPHPRGVAAGRNRMREKSALVLPIACADKRARGEEDEPEHDAKLAGAPLKNA